MEPTKEVAKIEPKGGLVQQKSNQILNEWGVEISKNDVTIPKLLIMQPMAQLVTAGEAKFGELRDSLEKRVHADFSTDMEFIPFYLQRVWVEYEMQEVRNGKDVKEEKVYRKTYPVISVKGHPEFNDELPYNDIIQEDGREVKIVRDRVANYFVLKVSEMPSGLPYVLPFRRTSMRAGRALATQMFQRNPLAGKTPASVVFKLKIGKQSKGTQTWAVLEVAQSRESTPDEVQTAFGWMQMVKSGTAKIDEAADHMEAVDPAATAEEPINF